MTEFYHFLFFLCFNEGSIKIKEIEMIFTGTVCDNGYQWVNNRAENCTKSAIG